MKQSEAIDKLIIANSQAGQNDTKAYNLLLSMLSMYMNPNMANIFSSIFPVQWDGIICEELPKYVLTEQSQAIGKSTCDPLLL